ncbi:MAG: hypothetical protein ACLFSY_06350 [Desulfonatronovibrionaceae bacterium]
MGLNIALELRSRYPDSSIAFVDKESTLTASMPFATYCCGRIAETV